MSKRLDEIKSELDHHLGQRLMLKANSGRRKTVEQSGVLAETYRSVLLYNWINKKMRYNVYRIVMRMF